MDITTYLVHFLLAISLFFITNWIGRHSITFGYMQLSLFVKADEAPIFNLLIRIITPVVFVILVTAIFYQLELDPFIKNIYLVVIYYFLFRAMFNVITGRSRLVNWPVQILHFTVSTAITYLVYDKILLTRTTILPDLSSINNELWLIIIVFIYHLFNKMSFPDERTIKRKKNYIEHRLALYRHKYQSMISSFTNNQKLESLIYSIMLYEAFNRPKVYRILEAILFRIGFSQTLGIMQVKSDQYISDKDSVRLGVQKIINDFSDILSEKTKTEFNRYDLEWPLLRLTIAKYNGGEKYCNEIEELYRIISDALYPKTSHSLSMGVLVNTNPPQVQSPPSSSLA